MTPTSTAGGVFTNIPSFSRAEVQLLNWSRQFFGSQFHWQDYLRESLSGLVWKRGALNLSFTETSSADPNAGPKQHAFDKATVTFGRDPGCDIVLGSKIAARNHARIVVDRGQCFLEDLGSQLGTYLDGKKIPANQPHLIRSDSQVVIFPHTFTVTIRQEWTPDDTVAFAAAPVQRVSWKEFREGLPAGSVAYDIQVHPAAGSSRLSMDRRFVEGLVARVLREDNLIGTARSDRGLLEFLVLSVIRNASKKLRFPFQLCLAGAEALYPPNESGLSLRFSLGLSGITGACQIFVPFSLMASMRKALPAPAVAELPRNIPWPMAVEAANLRFRSSDLDGVEAGDVIQFDLVPALAVANGTAETVWNLKVEAEAPWRFRLEQGRERSLFMDANTKPGEGGAFNPANLPTRVQIVLDELQLTLAEISRLTEGGILELRAGKSDPVKVLVNGAPYGAGELVEIEGKLGVRLTSWGKA